MKLVDVKELLDSLYSIHLEHNNSRQDNINIIEQDYSFLEDMEYKINEFYVDDSIRHKYSSVYRFILDKYNYGQGFDVGYELRDFIESLDYINQRDNLNDVAKNKFLKLLDHIELEHLKLNDLYRIDAFTNFYYDLDNKVSNLENEEQTIKKIFRQTKMELKTIKIDFIGILSSILSLFTIFGLNSSIIPTLIGQTKMNMCYKIGVFIGANLMLVICIFATLYFIKMMFYEYKLNEKDDK